MNQLIYVFLMGCFQIFTLIVIFQQTSKIKLNFFEILILMVTIFCAAFLVGNIVVLVFIPILYIFSLRHGFNEKKHLAAFYSIFCVTFFTVVGNLFTTLVEHFFDTNKFIYLGVMLLPCVVNYFVLKVFHLDFIFLRQNYFQIKKRFLISINTVIFIICAIQVGSYLWENRIGNIGIMRYVITLLFIITILILMYYLNMKIRLLQKLQLEELKEHQLDQLFQYTLQVETLYNEIRGVRHDFVNIIKSLGDSVKERDIDQIQLVYNSVLRELGSTLQEDKYELANLSKIKVPSVKSILSTKFIEATQKGINVRLEIECPLEELYMEELDYIRILSIFFDNAIEESEKLSSPTITIAINVDRASEEQQLIIENQTEDKEIDLQRIYRNGYSSKDKNRGLGLNTVREIINKYKNIDISTEYLNRIFTQKIILREK